MAASRSLGTMMPKTLLHTQDGRSLSSAPLRDFILEVPEAPPVAWAIGVASKPTPSLSPSPLSPFHRQLRPRPSPQFIASDARGNVTPLRRSDARRLIGELDPATSPLNTMQSVARAAELQELRLGCGPPSTGSTVNRTKAHVLADMRAAMGLDPLAVPMGIAMQTEGGEDPSHHYQARLPLGATTASAAASAITVSSGRWLLLTSS